MAIVTAHGSIPLESLPLREQNEILRQVGLPVQGKRPRRKKPTSNVASVDARTYLDAHMTGTELSGMVAQLLTERGWLWDCKRQDKSAAHVPAGVRKRDRDIAGDGITDFIAVRAPRLIFIEVKREREEHRPKQSAWQEQLAGVPFAEYLVARPSEWEKIKEALW
jgi:hypothetical protein